MGRYNRQEKLFFGIRRISRFPRNAFVIVIYWLWYFILISSYRKIFWADWNRAAPKIEWANMDGSGRDVFVSGPRVKLPNSLAVDFSTDELCWADAGTFSIGTH